MEGVLSQNTAKNKKVIKKKIKTFPNPWIYCIFEVKFKTAENLQVD